MSRLTGVQKDDSKSHPKQLFANAVRSLHMRQNAPPPIPIPVNPVSTTIQAMSGARASQIVPWITLELSNYPPQLTREDVLKLFKEFMISPDFALPNTRRLAYPLRARIRIAGKPEADRAVKTLNVKFIGERRIRVAIADTISYEQKEVIAAELADELITGIINTARIYYPHLASKILEVRECTQQSSIFVFLQARNPVTSNSDPNKHYQPTVHQICWELIAAGRSNGNLCKVPGYDVRLAALKDLRRVVEKQGVMRKTWEEWPCSHVLDLAED